MSDILSTTIYTELCSLLGRVINGVLDSTASGRYFRCVRFDQKKKEARRSR